MCGLPIDGIRAPPPVLLQSVLELIELDFLCLSEVVEHARLCICGCRPCQRGLTTIDVVIGFLRLLRRAGPGSDKLSSHGCAGADLRCLDEVG